MHQMRWRHVFLFVVMVGFFALVSTGPARSAETTASAGGGIPWWWIAVGALALLAVIIVVAVMLSRPKALGIAASLVIENGEKAGTVVPLKKTQVSIGSEDDNDIILTDEKIAKHHAELRYEKGSFTVVDLNSLYGTYVDGSRIESQPIEDKTTFALANNVKLTLQLGGASES